MVLFWGVLNIIVLLLVLLVGGKLVCKLNLLVMWFLCCFIGVLVKILVV